MNPKIKDIIQKRDSILTEISILEAKRVELRDEVKALPLENEQLVNQITDTLETHDLRKREDNLVRILNKCLCRGLVSRSMQFGDYVVTPVRITNYYTGTIDSISSYKEFFSQHGYELRACGNKHKKELISIIQNGLAKIDMTNAYKVITAKFQQTTIEYPHLRFDSCELKRSTIKTLQLWDDMRFCTDQYYCCLLGNKLELDSLLCYPEIRKAIEYLVSTLVKQTEPIIKQIDSLLESVSAYTTLWELKNQQKKDTST